MKLLTVMRTLLLILAIHCHISVNLTRAQPTCTTWKEVTKMGIVPEKYFTIHGNETWLVDDLINPFLEVCVYKCAKDVYVVLEEDWSSSLNEKGKTIVYFETIYILDNGKLTRTSFPQGYNHKIMVNKDEITILLSYLYRSKFDIKLSYKNGVIKTVE